MELLINNALVIDGTGRKPLEGYSVGIRDGRITHLAPAPPVPPSPGRVVDAGGRVLLPGLFNCHVHLGLSASVHAVAEMARDDAFTIGFRALANARRMLRQGITTVRDTGSQGFEVISLRNAIQRGIVEGPRIVAAGQAILMTGGHFMGYEADGVDAVRKAARVQLRAGADFVKLMATGGVLEPGGRRASEVFGAPQLTAEEMKAAVEAARMAGKTSAAHAFSKEGIRNALRAGVDVLEHGTLLDDEAISMMLDNQVFLVPTLAIRYLITQHGRQAGLDEHVVERSRFVLENQLAAVQRARARGVKVALGTDGGGPLTPHQDITTEARCLKEAGMSPAEIVQSLTSISAALVGWERELGTVEVGKRADLVLLEGNPLEDLENLGRVLLVLKEGRIVFSRLSDLTMATEM